MEFLQILKSNSDFDTKPLNADYDEQNTAGIYNKSNMLLLQKLY